MRNTKLTLSALFAACLLTTPVTAKEWKTVRFGVEGAYPPFSWTDASGEIKGFDIDLAHALCQQMAVKCELVAQDWDGMIPALLSRKYDAIIAATALVHGFSLVTRNTKDFETIKGLPLINPWHHDTGASND